jgi:hypothetical protein
MWPYLPFELHRTVMLPAIALPLVLPVAPKEPRSSKVATAHPAKESETPKLANNTNTSQQAILMH